MKRFVLLCLAIQLLSVLPAATAAVAPAQGQGQAQAQGLDDVALSWLAGLEQQGDLPVEMTAPRPGPAAPPALDYEDAHPACDLDGDGVRDMIVNKLTLSGPPGVNGAPSQVRAVSGADGHELWKVRNLRYVDPRNVADISFQRMGRPTPTGGDNVGLLADANEDGVCDVFAWGYASFNTLSGIALTIGDFSSTLKVLDGKTGAPLWTMTLPGQVTQASGLVVSATEARINGTPTGFVPILTPKGPKVLVKTSDIEYTTYTAPIGIPNIPILQSQIFAGAPMYRSARVDEHIQLVDAKTGKPDWTRDILQVGDAKFTNVTWISGVGDIAGDGDIEVVLDQFVRTNPRSNEIKNPVDGTPMYRNGRGMRAMTLSGTTGEILWTSLVLDPLLVQPNLPIEENRETLLWTRATVGPDFDGDGKQDVLASYVVQEEGLGRSLLGSTRTHFVGLHGANGSKMWDVRQQGWGVIRGDGDRYLSYGMVDVPTPPKGPRASPPSSCAWASSTASTARPCGATRRASRRIRSSPTTSRSRSSRRRSRPWTSTMTGASTSSRPRSTRRRPGTTRSSCRRRTIAINC